MILEYWERDTLKGDHSRATNPSGTCKHEAQRPTSHMPQTETVCRQCIHHSTAAFHHSTTAANPGLLLTLMPDAAQVSLCFPVHRKRFHHTQSWVCFPSPKCVSVKRSTTQAPEVLKSFRIHSSGTRLCPAQHTRTVMKG